MCSSRRTGLASESWQPSYLSLTWVGTTPNRGGWVSPPASATLTLTDLQKASGPPDWFKGHHPCKESSRLGQVSAQEEEQPAGHKRASVYLRAPSSAFFLPSDPRHGPEVKAGPQPGSRTKMTFHLQRTGSGFPP